MLLSPYKHQLTRRQHTVVEDCVMLPHLQLQWTNSIKLIEYSGTHLGLKCNNLGVVPKLLQSFYSLEKLTDKLDYNFCFQQNNVLGLTFWFFCEQQILLLLGLQEVKIRSVNIIYSQLMVVLISAFREEIFLDVTSLMLFGFQQNMKSLYA